MIAPTRGEWHWFETRDARQHDEARRIRLPRSDLVSVVADAGLQDTTSLDAGLLTDLRDKWILVREICFAGLVLRGRCGDEH